MLNQVQDFYKKFDPASPQLIGTWNVQVTMPSLFIAALLLTSTPQYTAKTVNGYFFYGSFFGWDAEVRELPRSFWPTHILEEGQPALGFEHDSDSVAAVYEHGRVRRLPLLPGFKTSRVLAINNKGEMVGDCGLNWYGRPTLWTMEGARDLGSLPGDKFAFANDINDEGLIVGGSRGSQSDTPVIFKSGKVEPLTLPEGATGGQAQSVNNSGLVVGRVTVKGAGVACAWREGKPIVLGKLPGQDYSQAVAVNGNGDIVGHSGPRIPFRGDGPMPKELLQSHVFLWREGRLYDLTEMVKLLDKRLFIYQADAINEKGQIMGKGTIGKDYVWFILTPK